MVNLNEFMTTLKDNGIITQKVKSPKSKTLDFYNKDSVKLLYTDLKTQKVIVTLPLSDIIQKDNKVIKGLITLYNLKNSEYKGKIPLYPAYDLKVILDEFKTIDNCLNFVNMSKFNKMGLNSWVKFNYSKQ